MKNFKSIYILFFLFLFSCKKETEKIDDGGLVIPTGKLWMHLHSYIDQHDVDTYGNELNNLEGRKFILDFGQYFLTDFQLVKLNGEVYSIDTTIVLKTLEQESYLLGNIPIGNYKEFRFKLGLNNFYNNLNPAELNSGELQDTAMWFNSDTFDGDYIHFNAKGQIDTSKDFSGKMASFNYRIGTEANLCTVQLPENNFAIYDGLISYIHLKGDFAKLFNGIKLSEETNLKVINRTDNQSKTELISILKQNIESAFFEFE